MPNALMRIIGSGEGVMNPNSACRIDFINVPADNDEVVELLRTLKSFSALDIGEVTCTNPFTGEVYGIVLSTMKRWRHSDNKPGIELCTLFHGIAEEPSEAFTDSTEIAVELWVRRCITVS
jgi:hypothetical protein